MSYNTTNQKGLGAVLSDDDFVAAAKSMANTFADTHTWTQANAAAFAAWAKLAYEQKGGQAGVNWFQTVVNDQWVNGGLHSDAYDQAMLTGLAVLGDQATVAGDIAKGHTSVTTARKLTMTRAPAPTTQADTTPGTPPPSPPPVVPVGWWAGLTNTQKDEYIVGGIVGVAAIGGAAYYLLKKPKGAMAPAEAKANRRRCRRRRASIHWGRDGV